MEQPQPERNADGIDMTLVRSMLSLTPDERLDVLTTYSRGIAALRGDDDSPSAHYLRLVIEENRRLAEAQSEP